MTKRAVAVPVSVPIETVAKMMGLSEEGQAWIVKWWPVLARMAEYRPRSFARFCAILELINKYDLTEEEILSIV